MSKITKCVDTLESAIDDLRAERMETFYIVAALGEMIVRAAKQEIDSASVDFQNVMGVLKAVATLAESEADRLNLMYIDDLKKQAAA
jgi:hypothetical protein